MGEVNPPFALQNAGATHTAAGDRMMFAATLAGAVGSTLVGRGGVHPDLGASLVVQQTGSPSMAVQVLSGVAIVPGNEFAWQGNYVCINDGAKVISVAAAHGTLPRIDAVVARVYDSQYSGSTNTWALEVLTGTAASSPSAPSTPANAIRLYTIAVGAGVSSISNGNLSDQRQWATGLGGIIPVKSLSERDALTSGVSNGQGVFRLDSGTLEFLHNGVWVPRSQRVIQFTEQVSNPPMNVTGSYVDFTSGQWPALAFTVPPSGAFRITISAQLNNTNTATSTCWANYRMSGGVASVPADKWGLSIAGTRLYGSKSYIHTGAPAGSTVTVTPVWNISSGSAATAFVTGGQLSVELLT